jgi:TolB-like protein
MTTLGSFGSFVLDRERSVLLRDGQPVPLGQRAFAVLAVLAENPGRTVPKAELMAQVWPGTFVEEGNLTVQIATLRKALGATADGQSWIVTVPRVGYRLLTGTMSPLDPAADLPDRPRLAVSPFRVMDGSVDQTYFADGLREEIITALSRFRSFAVVSRTSSSAHREADARHVASELGVRYVLEGSVQRAGDRLRLTAHLIDADSAVPLWAERFEGSLEDIFDVQDRITESVAMLVEPRIQMAEIERSRRERPGSFAVYDIYLRALAEILSETEPGNVAALALLEEGLALEPDNALLLTSAAWALEHRLTMGWAPLGPDDRQRCADLARRGLERGGSDPVIMARCGLALLQGAQDYDLSLAALQTAVEASPNNLMIVAQAGIVHLHCGSLDEALRLFHRATRLAAGDLGAHFALCGIAHVHLVRGEFSEALTWATRAYAANPNFDPTLWMLIASNAHLGRPSVAHLYVEQLQRLAPGVTVAKIRTGQPAKDPSRTAALLDGLRLAGLPEK